MTDDPVRATRTSLRGHRTAFIAGLMGGLLVATLAVAILATSGKVRLAPAPASIGEIVLPDRLAGMVDYLSAYSGNAKSAEQISAETARIQRIYLLTSTTYSEAFDGAATSMRRYVSSDLSLVFDVVAVRASSSPLLPGVLVAPADLGLLALPSEVRNIEGADCLVRRFIHGPGTLDPLNQQTDECHRSGPAGSVWLFAKGAETSTAQLTAVATVNAAFDGLSRT